MILGVPFLRNVYTVMAYSVPNPDGSFTGPAGDTDDTNNVIDSTVRPRLGLMPLTDPTTALNEFNTVRVLNQALPPSNTGSKSSGTTGGTNSDANTRTVNFGGKKLSVGIIVLIALLSFFALCAVIWAVRWLYYRKRLTRRGGAAGKGNIYDDMSLDQKAAYQLARRGSAGLGGTGGIPVAALMTGTELRETRSRSYVKKEGSTLSGSTMREYVGYGDPEGDEFGFRRKRPSEDADDPWNPSSAVSWKGSEKDGEKTLVSGKKNLYEPLSASEAELGMTVALVMPDSSTAPSTPQRVDFLPKEAQQKVYDEQYQSPPSSATALPNDHRQTLSVDKPLLPTGHRHVPSVASVGSDEGLLPSESYIVPDHRHSSSNSMSYNFLERDAQQANADENDDLGELGIANGVSMAGVGSASRTSKLSSLSLAPAFRDSNYIDGSYSPPPLGGTANRESVLSASSYGSGVLLSSRIEEEEISPTGMVLHSDLLDRIKETTSEHKSTSSP